MTPNHPNWTLQGLAGESTPSISSVKVSKNDHSNDHSIKQTKLTLNGLSLTFVFFPEVIASSEKLS